MVAGEDGRETEGEGKEIKAEMRGEGGIIIPGINPRADVPLVLGCEGVACDPVHLGPNERLTDWLTSTMPACIVASTKYYWMQGLEMI